jgi:hypothetical protein
METELILSVGGMPPLSARGCIQQIMPIPQGNLRRTINGELIYVGRPIAKYRSVIYCTDKASLATEGLSPGVTIQVGCIQRLWQKVLPDPDNKPIMLERTPVSDSVIVIDEQQRHLEIESVDKQEIRLKSREGTCFVSYRPWLNMKTVRYNLQTNEWGLTAGWHLELEEI